LEQTRRAEESALAMSFANYIFNELEQDRRVRDLAGGEKWTGEFDLQNTALAVIEAGGVIKAKCGAVVSIRNITWRIGTSTAKNVLRQTFYYKLQIRDVSDSAYPDMQVVNLTVWAGPDTSRAAYDFSRMYAPSRMRVGS
jgi:hypothetical protein